MFSLEHVGKAAGVFNPEKFLWVNFHYLKSKPLSQLAEEVVPYIQAKGYPVPQDRQWLEKMIATLRERAKTLVELVEMARYYLDDRIVYDENAAAKFLTAAAADSMSSLAGKLAALSEFTEANIEHAFTQHARRTSP